MDLIQFLSDWLTYAADNVKAVESLNAFEECLDFMSLNAMKCDIKRYEARRFCTPPALNLFPKND